MHARTSAWFRVLIGRVSRASVRVMGRVPQDKVVAAPRMPGMLDA